MATGEATRKAVRRHRGPRQAAPFAWALAAALLAGATGAGAAEDGPTTFMGQKVTPHRGAYLVLKDANVRARPETKAKRVGSVKAGTRVEVVARAAGAWVAVRDKGKDLGFIYDQILMPLIDGALARDLTGKVARDGGPECSYRIRFEGKSPVEGQDFEIADYDVLWRCTLKARKIKFRTPMFLTEAPYQLTAKPVYQINIDILDLFGGYEEILSTIFLYDRDRGEVQFDAVSISKYGKAPVRKKADAKDVAEALEAAVRIAVSAWNKTAWDDLIKNMPEGG